MDIDTTQFAHALEDLPDEVLDQAAEIAGTQPGLSLRRRVVDDCETVALDAFGTLEQAPLLHFLSRYPITPYTYQVSAVVLRGQRPDAVKLADLAARGTRATVNLCAEMDGGDAPAIVAAGLAGVLRTTHVPITDMEPPTIAQLTGILDLLSAPDAELTYVHCEAGKGRTGAVIACYRMAVMGWDAADALIEAANFGCSPPGQLAFIRAFGDLLVAGPVGRYPLLPLGSVRATPEELARTVRTVAAAAVAATAATAAAATEVAATEAATEVAATEAATEVAATEAATEVAATEVAATEVAATATAATAATAVAAATAEPGDVS